VERPGEQVAMVGVIIDNKNASHTASKQLWVIKPKIRRRLGQERKTVRRRTLSRSGRDSCAVPDPSAIPPED
jgi:hypothetical protein